MVRVVPLLRNQLSLAPSRLESARLLQKPGVYSGSSGQVSLRMPRSTCSQMTDSEDKTVIIFEEQRYDVTRYLQKHPGGPEALKRFHEQDATEVIKKQDAHTRVSRFIRTKLAEMKETSGS